MTGWSRSKTCWLRKTLGIYTYVRENGFLETIRNCDRQNMKLFSRDAFEQVRKRKPGWKECLPECVAEMIEKKICGNLESGSTPSFLKVGLNSKTKTLPGLSPMYLSNFQRTLKVVGHLFAHPQNLIPYFRYSVTQSSPLELELPWWSLSAIRKMKEHLKRDHRVFEWGSGGSTVFLAKECKELTSIEHDPNWFEQVQTIINEQDIGNSRLLQLKPISRTREKLSSFSLCHGSSIKARYHRDRRRRSFRT